MKAIVQDRYGSPDVLRMVESDVPAIDGDQVLVRQVASSMNGADVERLRGDLIVRLSGPLRPSSRVPGSDVAGVVEAVGPDVTDLMPGDEVFGDVFEHGFGAFAEYVRVPGSELTRKPTELSFEAAATLPQAGALALQGLIDGERPLGSGDRVLVNGAGGGVGTFTIQIAKSMGAHVTAVDGAGKLDVARSLGADRVIDYRDADFTDTDERYDRIVDMVARHSPGDYRRILTPDGVCFLVGGSLARVLRVGLADQLRRGSAGQRLALLAWRPNDREILARLASLIVDGVISPSIHRRYALGETSGAYRDMQAGRVTGKAVIVF